MPTAKVNWIGPFLGYDSLSHVNREVTAAMSRGSAIPVSRVCPPPPAAVTFPPEWASVDKLVTTFPSNDADVTIRHEWPPQWQRVGRGKLVVMQPWEYGALPEKWVGDAGAVDEFWAYSEYVRRVYIESGVPEEKVFRVPMGFDENYFHPAAAPLSLPTRKRFKFLFVGGTISRKGADLLLSAYVQTFNAGSDVCLVIKDFGARGVYRGQTLEPTIRGLASNPNAPEILYLTDDLPPALMPGLYRACDCLVHPYRGEGFGLPVLEAMACGLPVIVTAGGSTDDFAASDLVYPIPAKRVNIGRTLGGFQLRGEGWVLEPDLSSLQRHMVAIAADPEPARTKGRAAAEAVRQQWTWTHGARIAWERVERLCAK